GASLRWCQRSVDAGEGTCGFDCVRTTDGRREKKILEKGRVWACKNRKRQQKKAMAPSVRRAI
ncbi:hypothetical protein PISMIDRAFT_676349, partial [Pisolithus microcarpus 441]